MFKIHAISDTHRKHLDLSVALTGGDLLVHAGDADCFDESSTETFLRWCMKMSDRYSNGMIFTCGNHDLYIAEFEDDVRDFLSGSNVHLLINESRKVGGFNIYASPYSTASGDRWTAYSGSELDLQSVWNKIPTDTDILISHTPPAGILDGNLGSASLLARVLEVKPKVHIFGHIHHGFGQLTKSGTIFVNAAAKGLQEVTL